MERPKIIRPFWLVCEAPGCPVTLRPSSTGSTLPVFGFEEEAELFCFGPGAGWRRIEKVTVEGLISVLSRLPDVERVALDPPGTDDALVRPVSIGRQDFLAFLREKARTDPAPHRSGH